MASGYGISGIGYPMGLSTYGLGAGGTYGSYDNMMPSMLSAGGMTGMDMNSSLFGGMGSMYGMGGMMGMYNPAFMAQMQNQIEANQLQHAQNMHQGMLNYETSAYKETDRALINKIAANGDVQQGIQNLYSKVTEGDQDGICEEFDKLKKYIYNTYKKELDSYGSEINPATTARQIIKSLYGSIISAQTGQVADFEADVKRYGDGAMMNGFMKGFRPGHHDRYVDETLKHCLGLRIDHKKSQDLRRDTTTWAGRGASVVEKGVYGAAAGATLYTVGGGIAKLAGSALGNASKVKFSSKWMGRFAIIGALAGMAADVIWQASNS